MTALSARLDEMERITRAIEQRLPRAVVEQMQPTSFGGFTEAEVAEIRANPGPRLTVDDVKARRSRGLEPSDRKDTD